MSDSKTMQAVRRAQAGEKVRDVARELDLSESAVYAALKREKQRERCPCCGQVVREGFTVDESTLKVV